MKNSDYISALADLHSSIDVYFSNRTYENVNEVVDIVTIQLKQARAMSIIEQRYGISGYLVLSGRSADDLL